MNNDTVEGGMPYARTKTKQVGILIVIALVVIGVVSVLKFLPRQSEQQQQNLPAAISAETAAREMMALPQEVTTYEPLSIAGVVKEVSLNNGALGNGTLRVTLEGYDQPVLVTVSPYVTLEGIRAEEVVAGAAVRLKKAYDLKNGTYLVEVISK